MLHVACVIAVVIGNKECIKIPSFPTLSLPPLMYIERNTTGVRKSAEIVALPDRQMDGERRVLNVSSLGSATRGENRYLKRATDVRYDEH